MSSRFYELQTEAAASYSRSSSPHSSHRSHSGRPHSQHISSRSSTSSDSLTSSTSSSYLSPEPTYTRASMDSSSQPRVVVLRCSRCAKCVETIVGPSRNSSDLKRVSTDDAMASGMVRFGHNLYYCERCAKMVGYK